MKININRVVITCGAVALLAVVHALLAHWLANEVFYPLFVLGVLAGLRLGGIATGLLAAALGLAAGLAFQFMLQPPVPLGADLGHILLYVTLSTAIIAAAHSLQPASARAMADVAQELRSRADLERYRLLAEHGRDVLLFFGADSRILEVNQAAVAAYGYTRDELIGMPLERLRAPEHRARIPGQMRAARERPQRFETMKVKKDGATLPVEVWWAYRLIDGEPTYLSIDRDVTGRHAAEDFARRIAEVAPSILYVYDLQAQRNVWGNREVFATLGYRSDDVSAMAAQLLKTLIHPDDWPVYLAHREALLRLANGATLEIEYRMRHASGAWRWLRSRDMVFSRTADGQVREIIGSALDMTDRREAEEGLRYSEERFRRVFENAAMGIAISDEHGVIAQVNPAFCTMLGYAPEDVVGRPFIELVHPEDRAANQAARDRLDAEGVDFELENRFVRKDGATVWVRKFVSALHRDRGGRQRVALITDVTQRRRNEEALREADRRKDEFLATLAHELRNPLAPLRNGMHLLRQPALASDVIADLHVMMQRQLDQMVRLIDDLLDVSRITRDKLTLKPGIVDLMTILQHATENVRPHIEQAGHRLAIPIIDVPLWVYADAVRLTQVFTNLLHNACKYTPPGGDIVVDMRQDGGTVVVSVTDDGAGIPPHMLERVFELFTQVDGSLERQQGGLGIGLTLVQRLVALHGGSVRALSEGPGRGSRFEVTLPLHAHPPQTETPSPPTAPPRTRRRILVVDDNEDAAHSLALLLEITGCEVRMAHDGKTGLAAAREFRPDIVLLDIGLPAMNGYEVCRALRAETWGRALTIVALTGWGQQEDRRLSTEAGFDRHLVKPLDEAALMNLVAEARAVDTSA